MLSIVRSLKETDVNQLVAITGRAFAGYPWYEELSEETLRRRWETQRNFPGFRCLVCENDAAELAGGHWSDQISLSRLETERGGLLAMWARENAAESPIVWERELVVEPELQNRGLGKLLRGEFLREVHVRLTHALILTRLREDNFPSIKGAVFHGYEKTGLAVPASQKPLRHEYWYKRF
jgi:GNAT superfamily N-acetyltransferase